MENENPINQIQDFRNDKNVGVVVDFSSKRRKPKIISILLAIGAVFLVSGVAIASFYVSNRVSGKVAIAPNAPASKPLAKMACMDGYTSCGSGSNSDCCNPDTERCSGGRCVAKPAPTASPKPTSPPQPTSNPSTPSCGTGLYCGSNPSGCSVCRQPSGSNTCCCPSGKIIVNNACVSPPSCTKVDCKYHWSDCVPAYGGGTQKVLIVDTEPSCGGAACPSTTTQACSSSTSGTCSGTYSDCKTTVYPFYECSGRCIQSGSEGSCCKPLKGCSGDYSCTAATNGKICESGTCQAGSQAGQCCKTPPPPPPGEFPECDTGLYCGNPTGCSTCLSNGARNCCCPKGQTIVNNKCTGSPPTGPAPTSAPSPTSSPKPPAPLPPAGNTCDEAHRNNPYSTSIKFEKSGTVDVFTKTLTGTITLSGSTKTITITSTDNGAAVKQATTFSVNAGETYNLSIRLAAESSNSIGWIPPKATNTCGPTNSVCGGDSDITALRSLASTNSDLANILADGYAASVQCWGDANNSSSGYDYNDFAVIFGYDKASQREALCDTSKPATASKSVLYPGESVVITTHATDASVTTFVLNSYNPDNTSKPVCQNEITPVNATTCPNGGGFLQVEMIKNSTDPKSGSVTIAYEQLFGLVDTNWGKKPKSIMFSGYFHKQDLPWSLPDISCQVTVSAGVAPQCVMAKVFVASGSTWVESTDPSKLEAGAVVRFGVAGDPDKVNRARFRINSGDWLVSYNAMKIDGKNVFYAEYTLTPGDYSIESEIQ